MAIFQLTIHDFCASPEDKKVDLSLTTGAKNEQINNYKYALTGFSMKKQMYQPTEIIADLNISMVSGTNSWAPVNRNNVEFMFKHRRITVKSINTDKIWEMIGDDFYVHEVIPEYRTSDMLIKFKIYTLDKLLTLKQTSRSFVGKKLLGDILENELKKYFLPFDKDQKMEFKTKDRIKTVKQLVYRNTNGDMVEHIFPYLVQYNESFYDMLARTTNRWGEFMYYEDGKLQFGYNGDQKAKTVTKYSKITYSNKDTSYELLEEVKDGIYEMEAAYDKNIYDNPVQKSPRIVRAELGKFNGLGDKYAMKKIASFFNTDQNIVSWLFNTLVDDGVSVLQAMSRTKVENDALNKKYFPEKGTPEQYGRYTFTIYDEKEEEKDGFNEFTEITSQYANKKDDAYNAKRYGDVFDLEQKAGRDMVFIDYGSTWPGLKLGNIIDVNGERFIVVGISVSGNNNDLKVQVTASGVHQYKKDKKDFYDFYPAMIPSGHVRYSGPQMATIKDASDPSFRNRVRVAFPWQGDIDKVDKKDATPWIVFATKGDGKPTTGKHNEKDDVMVGFIDGNVERPYVMGAMQTKVPGNPYINVDFNTPGGHFMRLTDGTGLGLIKFVSSALSPLFETLFNFIPLDKVGGIGDYFKEDAWSGNKYFEGGFTLSDNYGIYEISGSTDKRKVTISSPWGDVKIDAFTGITISAPNGDVKITGKNVTIEAGNNLKLESGTNVGWKLGNDKKFGDFSLASLGLTVAAAIASKVAEKIKPIDLKIVRSVVEVVMRPVEGALTVKSNRFLKLEAGKNECEYPKMAFNEKKKKDLLDAAAKKNIVAGAGLSDGVVELFRLTKPIANTMVSNWLKRYNICVAKKKLFEQRVNELQKLSNDEEKRPCKTTKDMEAVLWDTDPKKELEEADLGFTDDVKSDKIDDVSLDYLINYEKAYPEHVILARQDQKKIVFGAACELRKAIVALSSYEITQKEVDKSFGAFKWTTLPKDSKKNMFNAIHTDECKSIIVDAHVNKELPSEIEMTTTGNTIKMLHRVFCLNLLKELGLDKNRAKANDATKAPDKPKYEKGDNTADGHVLNDTSWKAYIDSLQAMPKLEKDSSLTLGGTIKDAFTKQFTEAKDAVNFKKSYQEMQAWADGNPGSILFGTKDNTYELGDKAINANESAVVFTKVESLQAIEELTADQAGDKGKKKIEKFMKKIKAELKSDNY